MSSRVLVPVLVLAGLALGVVWFFRNYHQVPVKQIVPASGEARLRPFLAAERFAERMGLPARELRSLAELDAPAPRAVLLMPNRRQAIDPRRTKRLLAWVQRGGHLVIEAELAGVPDPLLDAAGVRRETVGERRRSMALRAPGKPRFQSDGRVVSVGYGKGLITAATSLNFARNEEIGKPGNAELLWTVLTLAPAPSLQVFFRPERLSLWRFLVEHAAPALAGAFLLLGLWLWRIAPRFGPLPADAPPARRRLLDHLRASGRYLWTEGLRGPLAAAARDSALRRLARAQPDFAVASPGEQAARLAALAGIALEDAQRFIAAGGPRAAQVRGAEFMRIAAIAQRVHFALEKGSR
jgi:hypothetical protein